MAIRPDEDLADYVQRIRVVEQKVSLKAIEERSGGQIDSSYVSQIENRTVLGVNLTIKKISALAKGLRVPEEEILAVIRGKNLSADEVANAEMERFWAMYSDIPSQCQKDVMDLLEVLQRNHSISARRQRREPFRKFEVAKVKGGHLDPESDRQEEVHSSESPRRKAR
ncbi:MAG TPA: hypothetical protein VGV59_03415 [Pyrinomonadaceae bacterium]|nr:hypothetical protein [Pyrinomonadaceae bacterium]